MDEQALNKLGQDIQNAKKEMINAMTSFSKTFMETIPDWMKVKYEILPDTFKNRRSRREYRYNLRRYRHNLLSHGKHGLKRPRH